MGVRSEIRERLPVQPTPLVGRATELRALRELVVRDDVRLVTCTGPGGIGKTRLAAQAAADVDAAFDEGAWFVPLAAVADPALVEEAVVAALGLEATRPLAEQLPGRRLVVLDNFEQVLAAAPRIGELLDAIPALTVVVTSREPLRLRVEREFPVPPLPADDAVRLFEERAQAVDPSFGLSERNTQHVVDICRRVDGLPLAIELAASRVKLFGPQTLLDRLQTRLDVLVARAHDVPDRHRTMRNAIAWSYDLLSPDERAAFRRLAVFAGGFTLETAQRVCDADAEMVSSLLERSLLCRTGDRLSMLETVREFALEALEAEGQSTAVRARQAAWCLALAEQAAPKLHGPEQAPWLRMLEIEHENVGAVLEACEDPVTELRIASCLSTFWNVRGHLTEGRARLERALSRAPADAPGRAKALVGLGAIAYTQGDFASARAAATEALGISRAAGDDSGAAAALLRLGDVAHATGDYETARSLLEESLALWRTLGDEPSIATCLNNLGIVTRDRGDLAAARSLLEESLATRRRLGNSYNIAVTLNNLGSIAHAGRHLDAARSLYAEALLLRRQLGDRPGIASSLNNLGTVAYEQGDIGGCRRYLEESLAVARNLGRRYLVAILVGNLGELASGQGDDESARLLMAESIAMRRELGDKRGLTNQLAALAELELLAANADRARPMFDESLALARELGDPSLVARVAAGAGAAALDTGDTEAARALFDEALEAGDEFSRAYARCGLGALARLDGDQASAEASYADALDELVRLGHTDGIAECVHALGAIAADHGRAAGVAAMGAARVLRGDDLSVRDRQAFERDVAQAEAALSAGPIAEELERGRAIGWEAALRELRATTAVPLRREGSDWIASYDGRSVRLRDMRGLQYLATLCAQPWQEIHCVELSGAGPVPGHAGEVLDDKARQAYRERVRVLEDEIALAREAGDAEAEDRARDELDAIAAELAAAHGLGGRARKAADPAERARKAVTKCIRDALAKLQDVHPALWLHLSKTIRTGTFCAYMPER